MNLYGHIIIVQNPKFSLGFTHCCIFNAFQQMYNDMWYSITQSIFIALKSLCILPIQVSSSKLWQPQIFTDFPIFFFCFSQLFFFQNVTWFELKCLAFSHRYISLGNIHLLPFNDLIVFVIEYYSII